MLFQIAHSDSSSPPSLDPPSAAAPPSSAPPSAASSSSSSSSFGLINAHSFSLWIACSSDLYI